VTVTASTWISRLEELLSAGRLAHSQRVAELAAELAGPDPGDRERARLAGLLHDAAKELPERQLRSLAESRWPLEDEFPDFLHPRAAAALARSWGVTEPTVLKAIEAHMTGLPGMDLVAKAVYVADKTEEGRGRFEAQRRLAGQDLSAGFRAVVQAGLDALRTKGYTLHPDTAALARELGLES